MASLNKNMSSAHSRNRRPCSQCKADSTLVCGKCHVMPYCSRDCQKKNWPIRKVFCRVKTVSSELDPERSIQVILLPSDGSSPSFIRLPKKNYFHGGGVAEGINTDSFFHVPGFIHSQRFPAPKQAALKKSYQVVYKDDFLVDRHSKPNLCIAKLLRDNPHTNHWRGNVLLCKTTLENLPVIESIYEDMTMSDVKDAVEFLQDYTQAPY